MAENITVAGLVATTPRHLITADGLPITSFRLASSTRHYDHKRSMWIDGETNLYTVTAFRQLAINGHESVNKGDRILVREFCEFVTGITESVQELRLRLRHTHLDTT